MILEVEGKVSGDALDRQVERACVHLSLRGNWERLTLNREKEDGIDGGAGSRRLCGFASGCLCPL